MIEDVLMSVKE